MNGELLHLCQNEDVVWELAVLNNLLYAVGGHDGVSYLNSVER